ncbi:MAG TPA: GNAT family N-acetyltransferase [Candidatus Dormibacteraeota bacterium]|nr:GNAT family N-acetyltransferase [Candidatus Dormibacteraeota bacterium]
MEKGAVVIYRVARVDELHLAAGLRGEMADEMDASFDRRAADWRERYREYFGVEMEAGRARIFFACAGPEPVGMVLGRVVDNYRTALFGTRFGQINNVYVRPAWRRRGIGRTLMEQALGWLREEGCVVARLHASDDGRALYEGMGFTSTSEMEFSLRP